MWKLIAATLYYTFKHYCNKFIPCKWLIIFSNFQSESWASISIQLQSTWCICEFDIQQARFCFKAIYMQIVHLLLSISPASSFKITWFSHAESSILFNIIKNLLFSRSMTCICRLVRWSKWRLRRLRKVKNKPSLIIRKLN